MDRFGRRPGLSAAQLLLGLASITASVSVLRGSTAGLFGSALVGGLGSGSGLLGRAAVADMYPIEQRGVAVGFMLAAGTIGAIIGPQLVQLAHLLSPQSSQSARLAAAWVIAAIFSAVAFGCMVALRPDPRDLAPPRKTPTSTVKRSIRSEEHTSELQSPCNLVCRLLLGSEEHTSELQSPCNLVCRLLLRSEEHTSELQSPCNLVCRLLLEKKKHTSELQSPCNIVCRLLLENKNNIYRVCSTRCQPQWRYTRHTT